MKITWKTSEKPTGAYRSFFRRAWPSAYINDKPAFSISCSDQYVPSRVKEGDHSQLTIRVADWRPTPEGSAFTWRTLKTRAATLDEAKQIAQRFADANPSFFGA